MKRGFVFLACLFFLIQSSIAATYYVSTGGSDATGDGTSGKPWRTLRYAVSRVAANQGHIIKLSAGVFVEAGPIELPLGVSIEGAGKDVTVIKAASSFYYYSSNPGFAVEKFLIRLNSGYAQNGNQSLKNFTIDGDGKKLHGGVYVRYRNNVLIDGVKVVYTNFGGLWLWDVKDSRVTNVELLNCAWGSTGWCSGALNIGNAERLEIDHTRVDEGRGYGIKVLGPVPGILTKLKIHDCYVTVNPVGLWNNGTAPNIAIEIMQSKMVDCEIYNCYVDNHISIPNNETIPSTGVRTIRVHHNTIDLGSRAQGQGYGIELANHDVEIDHNHFIKGTYGIVNWGKPKKNWSIHHNVFHGLSSGWPGEVLRSQQGGLQDVKFYNNTIELEGTRTINVIGVYGGASSNVQLKNNLVINSNTAYSLYPNQLIHLEAGLSIGNLVVANNFLDRIPVSTLPGQYSNNKSGDPQIMRSGDRPFPYYSPKAGSPLIDAGVNVGLEYSGAAPDIGAGEGFGPVTTNIPPVVTLSSPVPNLTIGAGETVTLTATAKDEDGSISRVTFYAGTTKVGEDTSSPYSITWTTGSPGTYALTAVATDNENASATSSPITLILKNTTVYPVPGTLEAEDYSIMSGIQLEPSLDLGGGENVGWIETGDWLEYNINVAVAGTYKIEYRVSSLLSGGAIQLQSGTDLLNAISFDPTGAWQSWQTITSSVTLKAGVQPLKIIAEAGGFNLNWIKISSATSNNPPVVTLTTPSTLALTAPANIMLSAEASDEDGSIAKVSFYQGLKLLGSDSSAPYTFSWSSVGAGEYAVTAVATDNEGATATSKPVTVIVQNAGAHTVPGLLQAEDFDNMSGVQTQATSDTGGGANVGWIEPGDWMDYNVEVSASGTYDVRFRLASPAGGGTIELRSGNATIGTIITPPTGDWQAFTTVSTTVNLKSGSQTLRLLAASGGFNINWIEFVSHPAEIASVPATIQAEDYAAMNGIQLESTQDDGGGDNAGWIAPGDWMDYKVNVTSAGSYNVKYRVASAAGGGAIQLMSGSNVLTTTVVPLTGGWQTWKTVEGTVSLPAGEQTIRLYMAAGEFNVNWFDFSLAPSTAASIPGTIQAENYDAMQGVQTQNTTDAGGGENVGWIDTGDWMDYRVFVSSAGYYKAAFRVASAAGGGRLQLASGNSALATLAVPATGDWQAFTTVAAAVYLPAGELTMRLYAEAGGFNVNWMDFTLDASKPHSIPGTVQAEDYAAMSGIQLETTGDEGGGQNVGWIDAGDWMEYGVNASTAGAYVLELRAASLAGGGRLKLVAENGNTATVSVPSTGDWQAYTTVVSRLNLPAGNQILRLSAETGGFNINWIRFSETTSAPTGVDEVTTLTAPQAPRIFSPNNDGINDYWLWSSETPIESCSLTIADQLGRIVYQTTAYENNWDGTLNGTPLPEGAYYYIANCGSEQIKGTITIVR